MAKPITDDELQLRKRARRRLVGAIALVVVVVVVLPWLVDDEPPPQLKNVDISIPPVEPADRKFPPAAPPTDSPAANADKLPEATLPPPEPATPATAAPPPAPATPAAGSSAKPEVAVPPEAGPRPKPAIETKPEAAAAPKPEAKPDPKPDPKAASGKGFVMQVGAFSTSAKAKQVQQQLKAGGVASYIEPVETATGTRYRVKAGPFASTEAAQKARDKLIAAKLVQGDPKVVPRGE